MSANRVTTATDVSNAPTTPSDGGVALAPEEIVEQLRALRMQIPEYTQLAKSDSGSLHRAATLDPTFVQAAINTIGAAPPQVQQLLGHSADELRQDTADTVRWSAVEDELRALLKGVVTANLVRRHRVGLAALQTYQVSRQLVRQPEHADLLPHVLEMRRANRIGRGSRKAAVPATTSRIQAQTILAEPPQSLLSREPATEPPEVFPSPLHS